MTSVFEWILVAEAFILMDMIDTFGNDFAQE